MGTRLDSRKIKLIVNMIFQRTFSGILPEFQFMKRILCLWPRVKGLRIPIFIKLATLSTLLILLVIFAISFTMLGIQRKQFTDQLIRFGEGMVRIAANNSPEKLLGEEDLALFQLVNDIAENEQVVYALITDENNIIRAHSKIDELNRVYLPIRDMVLIEESDGVKVSSFVHEGEEILFLESPIFYQKIKIGEVHLAISQRKILQNLRNAKSFILFLTVIITLFGILLSLGLSIYIAWPINKLKESTEALRKGNFNHPVHIRRNDELGDLGSAFNKMSEDLAIKEKIQDSFGRYVTPEIVELILANPDNQWVKGSRVEATVLFVDIRGFTAISEEKEPEHIVELLNDYFTRVTDVVIKHGGHLNKFVGDEAMAVFGTPVTNPQHAEAAVRAALEIQKNIAQLRQPTRTDGMVIQVGVGVNSGEILAGNLGSQKRMEYTVIGDNVNVASRLTSMAKPGEILISRQTYDLIQDKTRLRVEKRGKVPFKGRKKEVDIFNVLSFEEDSNGEWI